MSRYASCDGTRVSLISETFVVPEKMCNSYTVLTLRIISSAGRAFASQARGWWFESSRIQNFPGALARDFCLKGGHRWPTTNTVGKTLIPTLTQNPLLTRHQNNKIPIRLSHHLKPVLCPWSGLLLPCRTRTCRPVKLLRKFPS